MIKTEVLKEVIKDYTEKEIPKLIRREHKIKLNIPIKRVVSIIGPRRVGKTYLMFQLMKEIENDRRFFINFEDFRLEGINYKDFWKLIELYYRLYPENKKRKVFFFFDEIQNVDNWEKVIRHLLDNENCQIFITGSSSKLLSKEIATQLRGRTLSYEIYPFSFREFLKSRNFEYNQFLSSYDKSKLFNYLEEYLKWGGYPEVVLFEEKDKILKEIWEVTIARDIIERYRIRNIKALKLLIKSIKESKEFSSHRFYNYLKSFGIKVSKNTIYNYLEALKNALVVFTLHRYDKSYKNIEKSIPKIYLVDPGLYLESWEKSRALENIVFINLRKKFNENIYYYVTKSQKEVDFFVKTKETEELIEVTYELDSKHINNLIKASQELNVKNLKVITWDEENFIKKNGRKIEIIPLWKWLLTNQW